MMSMIEYLVMFKQTYYFQASDGNEKFIMQPGLKISRSN
jgi:hypothetical protein